MASPGGTLASLSSPSPGSPGAPPPDNPVFNAYEQFQRDTPVVTRSVLTVQAIAWGISWFVDLTFGLANIPYFTLVRFEIYRIVTSLFLCSSFFSLLFAYFSFLETGRRMEQAMGSAAFAVIFITLGILSNLLYIGVAALLDSVFVGGQYWFVLPSFGIWIVLFGVVAMECSKAPPGSTRKLFVVQVPTLFYPFCLFGIFTLLGGGFQLSFLISILLGYAFGLGYMEWLKVGSASCQQWEESFLESLTHIDGWVASSNALGSGASNEDTMNGSAAAGGGSGSAGGPFGSMLSQWTSLSQGGPSQYHSSQMAGSSLAGVALGSDDSQPGDSRPGRVIKPGTSSTTLPGTPSIGGEMGATIPTTGGRQLGGPSRRPNTDARETRLKAIEQRLGRGGSDHDPV